MNNKLKEIEAIKVVIGPHMTEKSYLNADKINQYVIQYVPLSPLSP